jgi:two-component system response regulator FlrC
MPDNLIEDMLFGHEKGAFTGAHREQKGLFEQAQGGTLFLDEIGEMPMHLQSKLLRVLQERQLTRLGGQATIQLNVRIVAATNKDLKKAIVEREFREDLYYRIATFRMRLLPLSERPGDIIPLAMQCLLQHDNKPWQLHPQAQAQLMQYPWPGNVRELENVMRRAMVLCTEHVVTPAHLMFDDWLTSSVVIPATAHSTPHEAFVASRTANMEDMGHAACTTRGHGEHPSLGTTANAPTDENTPWTAMAGHSSNATWTVPTPEAAPSATDLQSAARMNEHQVIMATLAATPSKTEAAKRLGISPRTLRYKLAQLREHGLSMANAY